MVWYSHLFQNFSQFIVIHTVKGFGIVSLKNPDTQALLISEDAQKKICSEVKSFLKQGIIRAIDTFQGSENSTEGVETAGPRETSNTL